MKIDNVLMDNVKSEYLKYYSSSGAKFDEKGCKWSVSRIGGAVEFGNGLLFVLEKPGIKTDFCFGYGQNGVYDDDSFRSAVDGSEGVKEMVHRCQLEDVRQGTRVFV